MNFQEVLRVKEIALDSNQPTQLFFLKKANPFCSLSLVPYPKQLMVSVNHRVFLDPRYLLSSFPMGQFLNGFIFYMAP